ncbi:DUF167 domain-containing protein [Candidatus Saccharibacteria bacterium]|nr:DUF167 domain-containing protein [Candidatus Saccharibacteria bacterium]
MKYAVTVKTGSSQEKIIKTGDHEITAYLHAKPVYGAANEALIKLLSKHFDVPKTTISIVRGQKSHTKIVDFLDNPSPHRL